MIKRCAFVFVLVVISATLLYLPATAKEDTAQIKLKKTAVSSKKLYTYTVQKGDMISTVIRSIPGITEADVAHNYQLIKELNPNIPNINKLEVGQTVILPGKPVTIGRTEETETGYQSTGMTGMISAGFKNYKIKSGDTLIKIIHRELKTRTDIHKTLRAIKAINPGIKNVNRIYAGSVIKLPGKTVFAKVSEEIRPLTREMASTLEKTRQPEKIIEVKEKKVMPPEVRLAVLKQIITQMNGTMMTTGNYYLPIPKSGQVTIDCSKIPLVEFDDSTTVFVDLENRAHGNLKKMISDNWTNYNLVKVDKNDDVIDILRKIINSTRNYSMVKSEKPLTMGSVPPVDVLVDWVISKSQTQQHQPVQGLRLIHENNLLLPKSVKNYYQKNGFIITEISDETGIVGKPEELYALPPVAVFPTTSAKDFSYALVSHLGFKADRDVDIQLFDSVKDGFNLSIRADIMVNKGDKKYVIHSQNLSPQFTNALKQDGNETIIVSDSDSPRNIMENILSGLNIPFTYGNFVFSGLEKNQAPYSLKFSGMKIDKNLYVVDFDIDPELRGLLQELWSADIARY